MNRLNPYMALQRGLLETLTTSERVRNIIVIEYNGQLLRMPSGKSSWNSVGAAKNALRNAAHAVFCYENRQKLNWDEIYRMVEFKDLTQVNDAARNFLKSVDKK